MNKLIRNTLAAATIAATGLGIFAPNASAAPTQSAQLRVSASVDCSRSKAISVTANLAHNANSSRRLAVRAVFSRWNGKGWNEATYSSWYYADVPAMGRPVVINVSANPGYLYAGVQTYTQVPGTQTWASPTFRWIDSYTVARPGGGTMAGAHCHVQDISRTPF